MLASTLDADDSSAARDICRAFRRRLAPRHEIGGVDHQALGRFPLDDNATDASSPCLHRSLGGCDPAHSSGLRNTLFVLGSAEPRCCRSSGSVAVARNITQPLEALATAAGPHRARADYSAPVNLETRRRNRRTGARA
jgi:hypothetical protein